jgi:hypothetical protein
MSRFEKSSSSSEMGNFEILSSRSVKDREDVQSSPVKASWNLAANCESG